MFTNECHCHSDEVMTALIKHVSVKKFSYISFFSNCNLKNCIPGKNFRCHVHIIILLCTTIERSNGNSTNFGISCIFCKSCKCIILYCKIYQGILLVSYTKIRFLGVQEITTVI